MSTEDENMSRQQKLQALGQFAGGIAHDFNNILSIIEGYTHIALRQLKEGTLAPEQLQKILKSTQRGAGLTRQLLSFGRQKIDVDEKINLAETLRQQHVLLKPLLGETVQLFMTVPENPVWLRATSDQITQIILNLALNARDAMPKGGELAIMCMSCPRGSLPKELKEKNAGEGYIRISVVDSGSGIDPAHLPRIFDPFFTTKDQGQGTGLGLSVVFGVIDQLKGHIEVSSKVGEGTSFDFYLPLAEPPADIAEKEEKTRDLSGKTILIAEDEPELRDILIDLFKSMRMTVLSSSNGNHALMVQDDFEGEIDFLLTDVVMPEMDGVKLGEMFQSLRPTSNVIYMSGYPFMDGRKDIQVPKDEPFISKPLREDVVRRVLERALERQRERVEH